MQTGVGGGGSGALYCGADVGGGLGGRSGQGGEVAHTLYTVLELTWGGDLGKQDVSQVGGGTQVRAT